MWFPTNKPTPPVCLATGTPQQNNNTTTAPKRAEHVVTTRFPTPPRGSGRRVTAVIAWGKRPVPFRTRKLRPTAPMVLHPGGCGRVGHRRTTITARPRHHVSGPSLINTPPTAQPGSDKPTQHRPSLKTRRAHPGPSHRTRPANPDPPSEPARFNPAPPSEPAGFNTGPPGEPARRRPGTTEAVSHPNTPKVRER